MKGIHSAQNNPSAIQKNIPAGMDIKPQMNPSRKPIIIVYTQPVQKRIKPIYLRIKNKDDNSDDLLEIKNDL